MMKNMYLYRVYFTKDAYIEDDIASSFADFPATSLKEAWKREIKLSGRENIETIREIKFLYTFDDSKEATA